MTTAISSTSAKIHSNKGVGSEKNQSTDAARQEVLLDEFSAILDQIAVQLSEMAAGGEVSTEIQERAPRDDKGRETKEEIGRAAAAVERPRVERAEAETPHKAECREKDSSEKVKEDAAAKDDKGSDKQSSDVKEAKDADEASPSKEGKQVKEGKDGKEAKEVKEAKEPKEGKEAKEAAKDADELKDPKELKPAKDLEIIAAAPKQVTEREVIAETAAVDGKPVVKEPETSEEPAAEAEITAEEVAQVVEEIVAEETAAQPEAQQTNPDDKPVETAEAGAELLEEPVVLEQPVATESSEAAQAAPEQIEVTGTEVAEPQQIEEQAAAESVAAQTEAPVTDTAKDKALEVDLETPKAVPAVPAAAQAGKQQQSTGRDHEQFEHGVAGLVLRHLLESAKFADGQASQGGGVQRALEVVTTVSSPKAERSEAGTETSKAKALPRMVASRTLEKVESVLKEAAKSRDGKTISVRLDPPSLGKVKVDVTLRDGVLHARLVADSPQVNQLLKDKAGDLQQTLRRLGFNVDKVNISVNSEQQNGNAGNGAAPQREQFRRVMTGTQAAGANALAGSAETAAPVTEDHWIA